MTTATMTAEEQERASEQLVAVSLLHSCNPHGLCTPCGVQWPCETSELLEPTLPTATAALRVLTYLEERLADREERVLRMTMLIDEHEERVNVQRNNIRDLRSLLDEVKRSAS